MTTFQKVSLAVLATVLIVLGITALKPSHESTGALQAETPAVPYWVSETATSGMVTLTGTDQRIIASSSRRHFLTIVPAPSCSQGAWISFANDASSTAVNSLFVSGSSTGVFIDTYRQPYAGAIHGFSFGSSCNINVTGY